MDISAETETFQVDLICRVCLSKTNNMKNLLTEKLSEGSMVDMFNTIATFKINENDGLPTKLCNECSRNLEISYNFHKQIENSHEKLLQYASQKPEKCDYSELATFSDDGQQVSDEEDDGESVTEHTDGKQVVRLAQFSYEEVAEAIEESKRKFSENVQCISCGFIAGSLRALSIHMAHLHKNLKDRWCLHCNSFIADDLSVHLTSHGREHLACRFCGREFGARGHLTEHLRGHTRLRPFRCPRCDKCFVSARHLRTHARTHTEEKPYVCPHPPCCRRFAQSVSLKNHVRTTHPEADNGKSGADPKNFCKKCDRKVRSLETHTKQFHRDPKGEVREDPIDKPEKKLCTICGKQFKTTTKLKIHTRVHTGEAPYKCSHCGKLVGTRNHLVVHERTHTGERPHACTVCGKRFNQSGVLKTHMRIHTGRPEECAVCGQRFCRPAELRLHMRKHTGEKPFLCTECGQAFVQKSHLVEHAKTHSEERPYRCEHCDRGFKQASSLKGHLQIHLGRKPYRCSQCPYACRQSYALTQHMKQHAVDAPREDRPYACSMCGRSFSTAAMLTSHTALVHGEGYILPRR